MTDSPELDSRDPRAYVQMAARVMRQIENGSLRTGKPIPSITTLSQQTGHARQTCAKALQLLVAKGLLTRYPGLGYYVTAPAAAQSRPPAPAASPILPAPPALPPRSVPRALPAASRDLPAAPLLPSPAGDARTSMPLFRPAPAAPPDEGEIPLVNLFEQDLWPLEEDRLCWLIVPVSDRDVEAATGMAVRYGGLTGQPGLTAVPTRWLHITVGHVSPADDMSPGDLAVMVRIARERCARLAPFPIHIGVAKIAAGGVACPAGPVAPLHGLERIVADARKTVGCKPPGAPAVIRAPHVALAYATGHGTTGPMEKWLAGWEHGQIADGDWHASSLLLARARHDGRRITWRPVETVTIGRNRRR